jgi:uncharacterized protein
VIADAASVVLEHSHASPIVLALGSVGGLSAGMRTTWTVLQTLRKACVSP